jgi:hypothetical protein
MSWKSDLGCFMLVGAKGLEKKADTHHQEEEIQ